jgi:hypothetical protein
VTVLGEDPTHNPLGEIRPWGMLAWEQHLILSAAVFLEQEET